MLVNVVEREATQAQVVGYQVAGKSGTAQIPVTGGYDPEGTIASFCGFFPADDPRFVVLVILNRPKASEGWGSLVAAPAFARIVKQLAVIFEVPPDDLRHQLARRVNAGG
jgi:cell division protein FtsI/penicillin-binding protein 2